VQRVPPGCRRIWVLVHKNILLASVPKNNFPADGVVPDGHAIRIQMVKIRSRIGSRQ
jgi:hypothetical protein